MGRKNDDEEAGGGGGTKVPTVLVVLYASRIGDSTHQGNDHHSGMRNKEEAIHEGMHSSEQTSVSSDSTSVLLYTPVMLYNCIDRA